MSKGILYIATGQEFIKQATVSAKHVSSVVDVPIALVTDREVDEPIFDEVIVDDCPTHSYLDKIRNLPHSPFDKTIFIDCDAYILSDISELFVLLEDFELAAAVDPNEAALRYRKLRYYDDLPQSVPEYNTGVLAYNNSDTTAEFFESWLENFSEKHHTDQVSFRKTLAENEIQFTALSTLYNCLINYPMQVTGEVKIIHDVSRTFLTDEYELEQDINAIAERINDETGLRVLHTTRESVTYPLSAQGDMITKTLWTVNKMFLLFIEEGLNRTVSLITRKIRRTFGG